jgi:AcrR family transcriptional regulator
VTASPGRDLRAEILAAAERLFIARGYHGLAMRELAEAVGVSKAALYYHFKDKEELFLAMLSGYLESMEAVIDQIRAVEATARGRIRRLVEAILSQPDEQRAIIRLSSQEMSQLSPAARQAFNQAYHRKFIDNIQAILQEGILSGELRPVDPAVATWALLGMMYPYFYPAHSSEMPGVELVAGQLITIYLEGIGQAPD